MSASVYLADLRHNYAGVLANDCMPLGIAYMKAVMDRELPEVRSRLFAYPDKLWDAIQNDPPDVLMLSNYMWNEFLSFHFAKLAKRVCPDMLVVMGGPNISLEDDRKIAYFQAHPEIDLYVLGEGDFLASTVVSHFLDVGQSCEKLGEREIPSSLYRRPDGTPVLTPMWERKKSVDEIPSPWLSGCLDEFFDGKLAPMIETNRGCPFTCTFCVQGVRWYAKVHNFSKERMREEIDYIGARTKAVCPSMGTLRVADSNYGMFERDVEISSYIGEAQKKYGWPTFIDATTGKNRPERIIESLEQVNGALVLYQAVQSLDEETLKNVRRSNIRKEAYEQIMIHVRGRGLRSLSDLILGLPGETLESHLAGIHALIDSGTNEMHMFQSMMLKGSEMETAAARSSYQFDTRFRVLPKNYGIYAGEKVFDVDEIVVGTDTLPFDDYLAARKYALACSIFWNNSWFEDAVELARSRGVGRAEWLETMVKALGQTEGPVRKLVDEFLSETRDELFPNREACVDFYSRDENFERLRAGEVGDNLMYKYRAMASFFRWPEVCAAALEGTRQLLIEHGAEPELVDPAGFWGDFHTTLELKHAHGTTAETLLAPADATLGHDVPAWIEAGMPADVRSFRLSPAREVVFRLSPEGEAELKSALRVWTTSLSGLTKGVTRIRASAQVRHCELVSDSAARAEVA